jgi:hypothetical protein
LDLGHAHIENKGPASQNYAKFTQGRGSWVNDALRCVIVLRRVGSYKRGGFNSNGD